jgi:moderate conductance mechanosensitive channel
MTKDFSYYVLNLAIDYEEDTDRVMDVLRAVTDDLRRDPRLGQWILEPLEVMGLDSFAESHVIIKARVKTVPQKQWEVGRELRRWIKRRFDAEGIQFPHRQLTLRVTPGSQEARAAASALQGDQPAAGDSAKR